MDLDNTMKCMQSLYVYILQNLRRYTTKYYITLYTRILLFDMVLNKSAYISVNIAQSGSNYATLTETNGNICRFINTMSIESHRI